MNAKICAVPNLAQHESARSFQHAKKMVHFCTHVKTSKILHSDKSFRDFSTVQAPTALGMLTYWMDTFKPVSYLAGLLMAKVIV